MVVYCNALAMVLPEGSALALAMSAAEEKQGLPGWVWILIIVVLVALGLYFLLRRPPEAKETVAIRPEPEERPPTPPAPAKAAEVAAEAEVVEPEQEQAEEETASKEGKAPEEPARADDLTRIEGIGPKISSLLQEAGIMSYAQLAETAADQIRETLAQAGLRVPADPTTWPEQAKLAAADQWAELEALQTELKGGRRV